jgi:phenylacetic acid degradation operon negative regulatory protein
VEAAALFGIAENSVRVTLARLLAAGRLERDAGARGRYRLGAGAEPVARQVRAWHRLEERTRRWDGGFVGVLPAASGGRAQTRRRARALRLGGFRALRPGLFVRPDNLRGGAAARRAELAALGLEPGALVFRLDDLDETSERRARGLWDAAAIHAGHAHSLAELEESERRMAGLSAREAMVETFLVGGRMIRQLVLDPLLPDAIVPGDARRALVQAMRRYDRLGRRCWAPFRERCGVPEAGAPADTRLGEGASRLRAAAPPGATDPPGIHPGPA